MKNEIIIRHSVTIGRPRDLVWDFTQDYSKRMSWDTTVLETVILQVDPRIVRLRTKGRTTMSFVYKLDDKPNKTSLIAKDIESPLVEAAGGSWLYEEHDNSTIWTQTNTIRFKKNFFLSLMLPFFKIMFQSQTRKAMEKAKAIMEG